MVSVLLGVSQIARVAETVARLQAVGAKLTGVVVNKVRSEAYRASYRYRYARASRPGRPRTSAERRAGRERAMTRCDSRPAGPLLACVAVVAAAGRRPRRVHRPVGAVRPARTGRSRPCPASRPRSATGPARTSPTTRRTMARAGIKGCVYRRYRNPRTGESVSVLLVCGRGGPISVHTPDVCYAGAGYRPTARSEPKEVDLGDGPKRHVQGRPVRASPAACPDPAGDLLGVVPGRRRLGGPGEPPAVARPVPRPVQDVRRPRVRPRQPLRGGEPCETFLRRALPRSGRLSRPPVRLMRVGSRCPRATRHFRDRSTVACSPARSPRPRSAERPPPAMRPVRPVGPAPAGVRPRRRSGGRGRWRSRSSRWPGRSSG